MSARVEIQRPDDETVVVLVDGEHLTTATHDELGWAGMEAVSDTACAVARALGVSFVIS